MKLTKLMIAAVAALSVAFTSCGGKKSTTIWQSDDKVRAVATSTMVADMVKVIGGDQVEVTGLMDPTVDPHGYDQTFEDTAAINSADVVFYSGLHLEGRMQDSLEKRASKGEKVYAVTDAIPHEYIIQEEGGHDPHVWGDPEIWTYTVNEVVKGLSAADAANAADFKARGEAYRAELLELKKWATARAQEVPEGQRVMVTSHDAFAYFGNAFGFKVKGLQGISSDDQAGLGAANQLVSFIKENKLKMIFPESSVNDKGIKAVANEAGVAVSEVHLFSDACGTPGDIAEINGESYDKGTYIGMIKHNVNTVVEGLK
ncbi:MAG: zinc ABC transporter substrate-binding protein [Rubritalea sp.]|uniref:metal ABC transporter solute-binding protein, Zn/Mn family n=1 Tax=Rubritalea sp. TaxID=2109375 RepID=UPI0032428A74